MKISKALKLKNKLIQEITQEYQKIVQYNSMQEGAVRDYDPNEAMVNYEAKLTKLIELKTKLHLANKNVYGLIFRLSELKASVKLFKGIPTLKGKQNGYNYRASAQVETEMTAVIDKVRLDAVIKEKEAEIEEIQEQLEQHNATKSIDFEL